MFRRVLVDFPDVTEKASDAVYDGGCGLEERTPVLFEEDILSCCILRNVGQDLDCRLGRSKETGCY